MLPDLQNAEPKSRPDEQALTASLIKEIRQIADRQMRREPAGHTLQATALVNEAWIRLAD